MAINITVHFENEQHNMADFSEYASEGNWSALLSRLEADASVASQEEKSGDLLLHFAIRNQAPPEVVGALLHANPQGRYVWSWPQQRSLPKLLVFPSPWTH